MRRWVIILAGIGSLHASAGPCPVPTGPVIGTEGTDFVPFQSQSCPVATTISNAYTGESLVIDSVYWVNSAEYYDGLGGFDILAFLNDRLQGDYLRLRHNDLQTVFNIEVFTVAGGNDVVDLSDPVLILGDVFLNMGKENDIGWGNVGNDTLNGSFGEDILNGGPGDDFVNGGPDNDQIYFGLGGGNDDIDGAEGTDVIMLTGTISLSDLVITRVGDPLRLHYEVDVGPNGDRFTTQHVEGLRFADNSYRTLIPCSADVSPVEGDLVVNIADLLGVISQWGAKGGPADVNADGAVNITDLLAVISAWGPCP
jgi:Ca2+-binding RTX toxin-like protein